MRNYMEDYKMFEDLLRLDEDAIIELEAKLALRKEEEFLKEFRKCKDMKEFKDVYLQKYREVDASGDYDLLKILWKASSRYKYERSKNS